jgi:hypothetical protein
VSLALRQLRLDLLNLLLSRSMVLRLLLELSIGPLLVRQGLVVLWISALTNSRSYNSLCSAWLSFVASFASSFCAFSLVYLSVMPEE